MVSRKIIILIVLLINIIVSFNIKAQDTINSTNNIEFRIKLNSKVFLGELPLNIELRPNKRYGIDFSVNYIFFNYIPGSMKLGSAGFKAFTGLKIYLDRNTLKNRTFYIFPNIFYKQIKSNNRYYSEDGPFIYGGGDNYDRYYHNLKREVKAFSLLTGWNIEKDKHIFEIYFGIGIRQIKDIRDIIKWDTISYSTGFNGKQLPTKEKSNSYLPSIHFGFCWSFDISNVLK